jgi:sporulation-control protein spo0M
MPAGSHARTTAATAEIDVTLPERISAGEPASATVELRGGTTDREIEGLSAVFGYGPTGPTDRIVPVGRCRLAARFTVHAADHRVLGTRIKVPAATPPTLGNTRVRVGLATRGLAASRDTPNSGAFDSTGRARAPVHATDGGSAAVGGEGESLPADRADAALKWPADDDPTQAVDVRPGDRLGQVLDAVSALGFFLVAADPVARDSARGEGGPTTGPVQQLRFRPRWGPYADAGDLVLQPQPEPDHLTVGLAVIDSRARHPNGGSLVRPQKRLVVRDTDRRAVRADLRALLAALTDGS